MMLRQPCPVYSEISDIEVTANLKKVLEELYCKEGEVHQYSHIVGELQETIRNLSDKNQVLKNMRHNMQQDGFNARQTMNIQNQNIRFAESTLQMVLVRDAQLRRETECLKIATQNLFTEYMTYMKNSIQEKQIQASQIRDLQGENRRLSIIVEAMEYENSYTRRPLGA